MLQQEPAYFGLDRSLKQLPRGRVNDLFQRTHVIKKDPNHQHERIGMLIWIHMSVAHFTIANSWCAVDALMSFTPLQ